MTFEKINISSYYLETHSSQTFDVTSITKIIEGFRSSRNKDNKEMNQIIYKALNSGAEAKYYTFSTEIIQYNQ